MTLDLPRDDADAKNMLKSRVKLRGNLCDTRDAMLRDLSETLGGGMFKLKEFWTLLATLTATADVGKMHSPTSRNT